MELELETYLLKAKKALIVGSCGSGMTTLCASIEQYFPNFKSVEEYNTRKYADLHRYIQYNDIDCVFILSRIHKDGFEETSWGSWIENLPRFTALVFGINNVRSNMNSGLQIIGEINAHYLQGPLTKSALKI